MSRERWKLLLSVLIGLNLALIWGNSLISGAESGALSGSVLAWLSEFAPFLATEWGHTLLRKAAHFSEFALLGLLWCSRLRLSRAHVGIAQMGLGLAVACIDETIQIFTPGRASSLLDVWVDAAGFAVGFAIIRFGYTYWKAKTKSNNQKGVLPK